MSNAQPVDGITELVNLAMTEYQKHAWQSIGTEGGVSKGSPLARAGHVQASATLHAAAVHALALVEAAQIQASAIDRLTAALKAQKPRRDRCASHP
jgi:hypothetical protein